MKNYFFDLLDQVTPRTEEHKDVLKCFLGFFPLFIITLVGLYSTTFEFQIVFSGPKVLPLDLLFKDIGKDTELD